MPALPCLSYITSVPSPSGKRDRAAEYAVKALAVDRAMRGNEHADVAHDLALYLPDSPAEQQRVT
jgi:hypothetical protein